MNITLNCSQIWKPIGAKYIHRQQDDTALKCVLCFSHSTQPLGGWQNRPIVADLSRRSGSQFICHFISGATGWDSLLCSPRAQFLYSDLLIVALSLFLCLPACLRWRTRRRGEEMFCVCQRHWSPARATISNATEIYSFSVAPWLALHKEIKRHMLAESSRQSRARRAETTALESDVIVRAALWESNPIELKKHNWRRARTCLSLFRNYCKSPQEFWFQHKSLSIPLDANLRWLCLVVFLRSRGLFVYGIFMEDEFWASNQCYIISSWK